MGAAATVAGQNLGAGHPERAVLGVRVAARYGVMIAAAVGILFVTIPDKLLGLFGLDDPDRRGAGNAAAPVSECVGIFHYGRPDLHRRAAGDRRHAQPARHHARLANRRPARVVLHAAGGRAPDRDRRVDGDRGAFHALSVVGSALRAGALEKHSSGSLSMSYEPEVWLKGPVAGVPAVLQPAAHALLQTVEDVRHALEGFSEEDVWVTPGGAASIGFTSFTSWARPIACAPRHAAKPERAQKRRAAEKAPPSPRPRLATLIDGVAAAVNAAVDQLRATDPATLNTRLAGRAGLPTTVGGLLFHAGEHSQRHAGQIVTTAKILRSGSVVPSPYDYLSSE